MPAPAGLRLEWAVVPAGMPRRDVARDLLARLAPGARVVQRCPRCGGDHGPLRLEGTGLRASATYAGGFAIVAVADAVDGVVVDAVGVDAEPTVDPRRDAAGMTGLLGAADASPRTWTRVEAALKADGRGLRVDPATVLVTSHGRGAWRAEVPGGPDQLGWDVDGPDGIVVSVAVIPAAARAAASGRSTR